MTVVELMPVADFPGTRDWGYDGVLPFAPDAAYGTPDDLKAFVDEAHGLGMSVLLDVVYNHFGPEGNYLHAYAPQFFDASRPHALGRGDQLRRSLEPRRCATSSCTTRSTGSRSSASTACAWTRSMRSTIAAAPTS